jgi:hypothetical protein
MFLVLIYIFNAAIASVPLPEGLFRNNINSEMSYNAVVYKIKLTHTSELMTKPDTTQDTSTIAKEENNQTQNESQDEPIYLKVVIDKSGRDYRLIQIASKDPKFSNVKQSKVYVTPDLLKTLEAETSYSTKLFYTNLVMLGFGDSTPIYTFLKKVSDDLKTNDELINKEKYALLERYKNFLKDTKGADQARIAQLGHENPIKPLSEDRKEKVNILLKEPMYKPQPGMVLLKKLYGKFAWNLSAQHIQAWFDNDSLAIISLDLLFPDSSQQWVYKGYRTFEKEHQLPSVVSLRANNIEYQIEFMSAEFYQGKGLNFAEKSQEYMTKHKNSEYLIPDHVTSVILF